MKVLKTLVLGLGIFLVCGCGKKVVAYGPGNVPAYGNYTGNKPGAAYGNNMNRQGMYGNQGMNQPTQGYNMPTYR